MIEIKDDAIFIADSHHNRNRQEFRKFLLKLQNKEIKTSQLFLMGDIFDFLASQIQYFVDQNQDVINLLNELSNITDIVYLEGNHDYNLQQLFPNIKVISRLQQPLYCQYNSKKVAIAHGDIFTNLRYNLYTSIIRNPLLLTFLNLIDINNWLTKKVDNWLLQKNICSRCSDFEKFSQHRISLYPKDIDLIIEGHFHYGEESPKYINVPSFHCDQKYYRLSK